MCSMLSRLMMSGGAMKSEVGSSLVLICTPRLRASPTTASERWDSTVVEVRVRQSAPGSSTV